MLKHLYTTAVFLLSVTVLIGQGKRDYQWIIGGNSAGNGIRIDFNAQPPSIIAGPTGIKMEGSNTSMCDEQGQLLFYSNGCKIVNAAGEIMQNGDDINPGQMENFFCPFGGCPTRQGVIALPAPESNSLYYVFDLDWDQPYLLDTNYLGVAPQRLFYQLIDMTQDSGYGGVVQKNQIAVQDTFARGNIQAARQANGEDWWIIVPKSHSNCYFLISVDASGVQTAQLKCAGPEWTDDDSGAQATFSPDFKKYIRLNAWNGLNIFDFDNATGNLSNPVQIMFPDDNFNYVAGVAVSPNSQYLYVCASTKVYQFDLKADDIPGSKTLIAEWDGFSNPYPTIFYLAALAPDGKIYISSTSSTLNLHVIEKPNCPGLSCQLVQHGIDLPAYNFATIPNIPHYRMSDAACDSSNTAVEMVLNQHPVAVYPNPSTGTVWINAPELLPGAGCTIRVFDLFGRLVCAAPILRPLSSIELPAKEGTYFYSIESGGARVSGKIVRRE